MGCVIGVLWVVGMVKKKGLDDGHNAYSWAWIDVVSILGICGHCFESLYYVDWRLNWLTTSIPGLCSWLCQAGRHGGEIHPPGLGELPAEVYRWLEHQSNPAGPYWRCFVHCTACD